MGIRTASPASPERPFCRADSRCVYVNWGLTGTVVAAAASAAVLGASVFGAVASNTMLLTPGNVQVVSGLPTEAPAAIPAADKPVTAEPEAFNVLLLGSDTREGQGSGFGSADVYTGARSDTAMLVHVDADRDAATVLSFPRDLRVDVPDCDGSPAYPDARFNVAFEVGGAACTVKVVQQLTGAKVDHVVIVDFKGFRQVVDALGGLTVCLPVPVADDDANVELAAGWQTLSGEQALGLARARKTLGDGSDIGRIDRQQALMRTALEQVVTDGVLTNPAQLYGVLGAVGDALQVSPSLASTTVQAQLAAELSGLSLSRVKFVTVPWVDAGDGQTVRVDWDRAEPVFAKFRGDAPEKSPTAKPSNGSPSPSPSSVDDTVTDPLCGGYALF